MGAQRSQRRTAPRPPLALQRRGTAPVGLQGAHKPRRTAVDVAAALQVLRTTTRGSSSRRSTCPPTLHLASRCLLLCRAQCSAPAAPFIVAVTRTRAGAGAGRHVVVPGRLPATFLAALPLVAPRRTTRAGIAA